MPGLMMSKSNQQMMDEEQSGIEEDKRASLRLTEDSHSSLAGQINNTWQRNRDAKTEIEEELLACLRQRRGEYSPRELQVIEQSGGANAIYMMLTATKQRAAASWLQDVLLPGEQLPWGLEATPVPELPPDVTNEVRRQVMMAAQKEMAAAQKAKQDQGQAQQQPQQAQEQGQPQEQQAPTQADVEQRIEDMISEVKDELEKRTRKANERMTEKINDKFEEGGFREAVEQFIEDFTTYPTAILKGPVYRRGPRIEWMAGWQPMQTWETKMHFKRVSPFDIYPSPHAETAQDGEFIERVRYAHNELYDMIGVPGYDEDAIRRVLTDHRSGRLIHWLWIDSERDKLENKDSWWRSAPGVIDGLHYWGMATGLTLMQWGVEGEVDPVKQYPIEAILIGTEVVRCEINDDPLGRRPYQAASYQRVPGAFWGDGLPYLMRDTQAMVNSVARSLADNLAIASGPQVMINTSALSDGEELTNLYPWKIWQYSVEPGQLGSGQRPVDFFQPTANASELLAVYERFERMADDETAIPRYTYGNERVGGAGSTASGLSMLFDATAKGIRKAIGHIDAGVMRPLVEKIWMDLMRYDPDKTIKADCKVVARGAAALLIKEQAQMRRQEFLNSTANPVDMQIIGMEGRAAILRENVKSLDLPVDDIVPKREEIERRMRDQKEQSNPENELAQAELKMKAQIDQAKLKLEAEKAEQDSARYGAELAQKEKTSEQDYKIKRAGLQIDAARFLEDREQKIIEQRQNLLLGNDRKN